MEQGTPTPPLGDVISTLLQNPAVMSAISSLRDNGQHTEMPKEETPREAETPASASPNLHAEKIPDIVNTLSPLLSSQKHSPSLSSDRRSALLCALKPYLCQERCDAIDTMLKIGSLTELLKNLH